MNLNRCQSCKERLNSTAVICEQCSRSTRLRLAEIPALYIEAGAFLVRGRGGSGSSSSERKDAPNMAALGFRQASDILARLEDWERTVRVKSLGQSELDGEDRPDVARAPRWNPTTQEWVEWKPSEAEWAKERPTVRRGATQDRLEGVCLFLISNARWLGEYEFAFEWVSEVQQIHGQGIIATQRFTEKVTQIKCPAGLEEFNREGEIVFHSCAKVLVLGKDPLDPVECERCGTEWTTLRLIRVAINTPGQVIWMDTETIAAILRVNIRLIQRLIKEFGVEPRGKRGQKIYDLVILNRLLDEKRHAEEISRGA